MSNFYLPFKPEFPAGGIERDCPNCGCTAKYQRTDLIYAFQRVDVPARALN